MGEVSQRSDQRLQRVDARWGPDYGEVLLQQYDSFIFDCDGVIWAGGALLPGAKQAIENLRQKGKRVIFVTNNSTRSRKECAKKFHSLSLPVKEEDIWPASFAAAQYLKVEHPGISSVFMIGCQGMKDELEAAGISVMTKHQAPQINSEADYEAIKEEDFSFSPRRRDEIGNSDERKDRVQGVVAGFDFGVDYSAIGFASLCLQLFPGSPFVATSRDAFDQLHDRRIPGMTATVSGIEESSGQSPAIVGKPSPWLIRRVIDYYGLEPERTLMVGDRLDTDILFGKAGKTGTMLVLTGCTTLSTVEGLPVGDQRVPDIVAPGIAFLGGIL